MVGTPSCALSRARWLCPPYEAQKSVMAGLVPAIHVFLAAKTWMPGTRPGMTNLLSSSHLCNFFAVSAITRP